MASPASNMLRFFGILGGGDNALTRAADSMDPSRKFYEEQMNLRRMDLESRNEIRRMELEDARQRRKQEINARQALGNLAAAYGTSPGGGVVGPEGPQMPLTQDQIGNLRLDATTQALQAGVSPSQISSIASLYGPDKSKVMEVGGRLVQISPTGQAREVYAPPPKVEDLVEVYDAQVGGMIRVPESQAVGRLSDIPEDKKKKDYSEGQLAAGGFAARMQDSVNKLDNLSQSPDFQPINATSQNLGSLGLGYLSRLALSDEQQSYKNAADDWIRAKLRKESGAAISPEEFVTEYETYFPVRGDSEAVMRQKANKRRLATDAMIRQSRGAFEDIYQEIVPQQETRYQGFTAVEIK